MKKKSILKTVNLKIWKSKPFYIWGIPIQIDLAVTLTVLDFFINSKPKPRPLSRMAQKIYFLT